MGNAINSNNKTTTKTKGKKIKKKKQQQQQKKRKEKMLIQHGANIGGFVGSTFHQQIDLDYDKSDNSSSSESEDEEEKLKEKQKEEELEKERNEIGETTKQRIFREKRLEMIKLICIELKKYDNDSTKLLNVFDKNGQNALMYAVRTKCYQGTDGYKLNYGSTEIVNLLMEMGADPDAMNQNAQTVISLIITNPPSKTLEILTPILNKANVNKELVIYESEK